MDIEVITGDITAVEADVLVNAANEWLEGGAGVDGAIHRAAGPRLAVAGRELAPCPPGQIRTTPAFDLQPAVTWIVHTVGPVWEGGDFDEDQILASCWRAALNEAVRLGAKCVAFPSIATGVYGYPVQRAASLSVAILRERDEWMSLRSVLLVAFENETAGAWMAALAQK